MKRAGFTVAVEGGRLTGWEQGDGPPVLMLHGGPGMSFGYLDGLALEIGDGFRIAAYQQRGLAPSTTQGPFEIAREIADAAAVLDALGWERAWVVGHSWGGHLLLYLAAAIPSRLLGGLALDPLGAVGDGGAASFAAAMNARTPAQDRARAQELDDRAMRGEATSEEVHESLRLYWPAYFASRDRVMPFPAFDFSVEAYSGLWESVTEGLPGLAEDLPRITVPLGFVAGSMSPMPLEEAAGATARSIPGAWLTEIENAGHYPWFEQPGCVRAALARLIAERA
ncbi:MAG TPA: alpha/beta hydrolase [Solirubrobacteraceae bacterium]|nr:alpha/beta hydrolase [Solirubrobacteraceae bacterium]